MYRRALGCLLITQIMLVVVYLGMVWSHQRNSEGIKTMFEIQLNNIVLSDDKQYVVEISKSMRSEQRILTYDVMEKEYVETEETAATSQVLAISEEDYNNLLRIVEAEAGGEDEKGKILVANVVINRVMDEDFPDSITEVIFQKENGVTQFSPVSNGRIFKVSVSEETVEAVNKALGGEDYSQGALYFAARKYANSDNMRWFDESLEFLFEHGGHEFFAE